MTDVIIKNGDLGSINGDLLLSDDSSIVRASKINLYALTFAGERILEDIGLRTKLQIPNQSIAMTQAMEQLHIDRYFDGVTVSAIADHLSPNQIRIKIEL